MYTNTTTTTTMTHPPAPRDEDELDECIRQARLVMHQSLAQSTTTTAPSSSSSSSSSPPPSPQPPPPQLITLFATHYAELLKQRTLRDRRALELLRLSVLREKRALLQSISGSEHLDSPSLGNGIHHHHHPSSSPPPGLTTPARSFIASAPSSTVAHHHQYHHHQSSAHHVHQIPASPLVPPHHPIAWHMSAIPKPLDNPSTTSVDLAVHSPPTPSPTPPFATLASSSSLSCTMSSGDACTAAESAAVFPPKKITSKFPSGILSNPDARIIYKSFAQSLRSRHGKAAGLNDLGIYMAMKSDPTTFMPLLDSKEQVYLALTYLGTLGDKHVIYSHRVFHTIANKLGGCHALGLERILLEPSEWKQPLDRRQSDSVTNTTTTAGAIGGGPFVPPLRRASAPLPRIPTPSPQIMASTLIHPPSRPPSTPLEYNNHHCFHSHHLPLPLRQQHHQQQQQHYQHVPGSMSAGVRNASTAATTAEDQDRQAALDRMVAELEESSSDEDRADVDSLDHDVDDEDEELYESAAHQPLQAETMINNPSTHYEDKKVESNPSENHPHYHGENHPHEDGKCDFHPTRSRSSTSCSLSLASASYAPASANDASMFASILKDYFPAPAACFFSSPAPASDGAGMSTGDDASLPADHPSHVTFSSVADSASSISGRW